MRVVAIEPRDRFSGLDANGWLQYPNLYHCPFCSYGVYFNQPSLDAGAYPSEVDSSALQKLKDPARSEFEAHVMPFLQTNPGLFTLAFHCPKCTSPVAVCFDATEVAMATLRFKPVRVFESEAAPNNAPQATCEDDQPGI